MYFSTVYSWIDWISKIHKSEIDLDLARIKTAAEKMDILTTNAVVITVGGTNGKGSTVAGLEAIYLAAGYRVGCFTSPILFEHNDYVRLQGKNVKDEELITAYSQVETARGDITLTPFEFYTLGALSIFKKHVLDVIILEVGLGGRLDAVNIIDPDLAIITNISLDHMDRLGNTREAIGREKAGILRQGRPAICGDEFPPASILKIAQQKEVELYLRDRDFKFSIDHAHWRWQGYGVSYDELPITNLAIENMAVVIMAVTRMQEKLPVTTTAIDQGLSTATLAGRIQIVPGPITNVFDVAHNPAAIALLASSIQKMPPVEKTIAVFSMLSDKDCVESIKQIKSLIDEWYVAPLKTQRTTPLPLLSQAVQSNAIHCVNYFASIGDAYAAALQAAQPKNRIITFGSFHTVAEVLQSSSWLNYNAEANEKHNL